VKSAEIHPNLAAFTMPKCNERNHSYNPAFPQATPTTPFCRCGECIDQKR
jgi:hypothetical protein